MADNTVKTEDAPEGNRLIAFLHRLVDRAGVSELHDEIDALNQDVTTERSVAGDGTVTETTTTKTAPTPEEQDAAAAREAPNA